MQVLCQIAMIILASQVRVAAASAEGFRGLRAKTNIDSATFTSEIRAAMGEAMGCGGEISEPHLHAIEKELLPMFRTLPKNSGGRLERNSLRYLSYRYFHQKFSLVVRGFEPTRPVNDSSWGAAEILSEKVPGFVESALESVHAQERGFDLRDAAQMVTILEQLIFDSESSLLEKTYNATRQSRQQPMSEQQLRRLLESYIALWLAGDDVLPLLNRPRQLAKIFPHWGQVVSFVHGQISALNFERQHAPLARRSNTAGNALLPQYSFDDAHAIVGGITKSFATFWESECREMKRKLVSVESHGTGRVPLSVFYGKSVNDAEWRFGESESYLRGLGALDETAWLGKQVIIPNYIQGASNCIVAKDHYMVCCASECEPILAEIELAVGSPMATPSHILSVVRNMSQMADLDSSDDCVTIDAALRAQLESAAGSNGEVPIHGRLFAQWLHYVFPQECPFPHKSGTAVSLSPFEFGDYLASADDMKLHAANSSADIVASMNKSELQWMSLWSEDEELIASITSYEGVRPPRRKTLVAAWGLLGFSLAVMVGVVSFNRKASHRDSLLPYSGYSGYHGNSKAHFV
eukprot:TRINITY_DN60280_c0_g1_i1.p1 TRINITY_DN60280_c0_g1~~TRINITY_DN60280_c0_g1_i1.p1  ORF type:complete len:602 (-),score=103.64 TRINITY_DN60280_c0_g1_i1:386-2122(-)